MHDMLLVADVAPHTGKIIKWLYYKMVYYTLRLGSANRQNCIGKLELHWKVRI